MSADDDGLLAGDGDELLAVPSRLVRVAGVSGLVVSLPWLVVGALFALEAFAYYHPRWIFAIIGGGHLLSGIAGVGLGNRLAMRASVLAATALTGLLAVFGVEWVGMVAWIVWAWAELPLLEPGKAMLLAMVAAALAGTLAAFLLSMLAIPACMRADQTRAADE